MLRYFLFICLCRTKASFYIVIKNLKKQEKENAELQIQYDGLVVRKTKRMTLKFDRVRSEIT